MGTVHALTVMQLDIKFCFIVLGIYSLFWECLFYFFFNGMWVWMLGLVCLACSFILLIASPFFVHQGPRWKITVEITPVTWNLIILRDRKSFLWQIELWFNCPRLFLCLFAFPIRFASVCGNCSQSSIPCRAEIDRRSWRKTDSQALNATFLEVFWTAWSNGKCPCPCQEVKLKDL